MRKRVCLILSIACILLSLLLFVPIAIAAEVGIKSISITQDVAFFVDSNGTLWTLGSGAIKRSMENVAYASVGWYNSYAVMNDGSLWEWGKTPTSGVFVIDLPPTKMMDDVVMASGLHGTSYALKKDGTLWAWGSNFDGRLGIGTDEDMQKNPVKVMESVVSFSVGNNHCMAVKSDGSLWTWGTNLVGQLGDGTFGRNASKNKPTHIIDDVKIAVAGDDNSFAIKTDGSLWGWGRNVYGQLGESAQSQHEIPLKIMNGVTAVAAGYDHTLALKADGSLWTWGSNRYGQLGDGTNQNRHMPERIMENVALIGGGKYHSIAVKLDGTIWAWGLNGSGQLGDGSRIDRNTPGVVPFSIANHASQSNQALSLPARNQLISIFVDDTRILTESSIPVIENGRILVPIRLVAEAIGADVTWDPTSNTALLTRASTVIELIIGSTSAKINDKSIRLDVPPIIREGRTLIPLRFIAEAFEQSVEWDDISRTVRVFEDMSFAKDSNLTEWFLGTGAIIAEANSPFMNPYLIGMASRAGRNVSSIRNLLRESWNVHNRDDLIEQVISISLFGHANNFANDVNFIKSLSFAEKEHMLKNASGMDQYMWPMVLSLDEKWNEKGIQAWDWYRAGHLCRWGYLAGYITLEEAYIMFEPVAKALRGTFSSWDEATDNYLDGFAYWGRIDVSKKQNAFDERSQIYTKLKGQEANNPRGMLFDPKVWQEPVKGIR